MFSNKEALKLIHQTEECFVTWATDQNAILSVMPIKAKEGVHKFGEMLSRMGENYTGPTVGRFFTSNTVTLDTLEEQQRDITRVQRRVAVFISWQKCTPHELITILEADDFAEPMDSLHGSSHIIRQLYHFHANELSIPQIDRLEQVLQTLPPKAKQGFLSSELECFLAALQNDSVRLKRAWQVAQTKGDWSCWTAFTEAAGDMRTTDTEIISELIGTLENSRMLFGPRFDAMLALGKIGSAAGLRAVEAIKANVYDSSESISATRDIVIKRLTTSDYEWQPCSHCSKGHILIEFPDRFPSTEECGDCYGLGSVYKHN